MPVKTLKPVFKPEINFKVEEHFLEERCTIVHCFYPYSTRIRIWPTTFLVQRDGSRKRMLQAFNISEYPVWKPVRAGDKFTLVFEGLSKDCKVFDLFEDILEPGGFLFKNIKRNSSDVYEIELE